MDSVRRSVPRLSFTGRPAPRLETGVGTYEVVDLSSEGIRIRFAEPPASGVTIGDVLRATLRFPADRTVEVEGTVLRVTDHEAALRLTTGQDRLALTPLPAGPASPRRTGLLW